jgi:hypothetical protein
MKLKNFKVEKALKVVDKLISLPLQRKFGHHAYTVPWAQLQGPLHLYERRIGLTTLAIFDLSKPQEKGLIPGAVMLHLWLPLCMGDCGVDNTNRRRSLALQSCPVRQNVR